MWSVYIQLSVWYTLLIMSNNKYTKQDCINSLQKASDEVEGKLSSAQYKELDYDPGFWAIARRFGTWNEAKKAAGLEVYEKHSATKEQRRTDIPDMLNVPLEEWKSMHTEKRYRLRQKCWLAKKKINRGCDKCNYSEHPRALHFHHIDPSEKEIGLAKAANSGYSKERMQKEIDKCILLCANCHSVEEASDLYDISELR